MLLPTIEPPTHKGTMTTYKIGRDVNGNKVCRVKPQNGRGFSIQTNGNLIRTHRDGVGRWTQREVAAYVLQHGTEKQAVALGIF